MPLQRTCGTVSLVIYCDLFFVLFLFHCRDWSSTWPQEILSSTCTTSLTKEHCKVKPTNPHPVEFTQSIGCHFHSAINKHIYTPSIACGIMPNIIWYNISNSKLLFLYWSFFIASDEKDLLRFHMMHQGHPAPFCVTSLPGYDMSTFIRRYSRYLNEKAMSYRLVAVDFTKMKRGYDTHSRTHTDTHTHKEFAAIPGPFFHPVV